MLVCRCDLNALSAGFQFKLPRGFRMDDSMKDFLNLCKNGGSVDIWFDTVQKEVSCGVNGPRGTFKDIVYTLRGKSATDATRTFEYAMEFDHGMLNGDSNRNIPHFNADSVRNGISRRASTDRNPLQKVLNLNKEHFTDVLERINTCASMSFVNQLHTFERACNSTVNTKGVLSEQSARSDKELFDFITDLIQREQSNNIPVPRIKTALEAIRSVAQSCKVFESIEQPVEALIEDTGRFSNESSRIRKRARRSDSKIDEMMKKYPHKRTVAQQFDAALTDLGHNADSATAALFFYRAFERGSTPGRIRLIDNLIEDDSIRSVDRSALMNADALTLLRIIVDYISRSTSKMKIGPCEKVSLRKYDLNCARDVSCNTVVLIDAFTHNESEYAFRFKNDMFKQGESKITNKHDDLSKQALENILKGLAPNTIRHIAYTASITAAEGYYMKSDGTPDVDAYKRSQLCSYSSRLGKDSEKFVVWFGCASRDSDNTCCDEDFLNYLRIRSIGTVFDVSVSYRGEIKPFYEHLFNNAYSHEDSSVFQKIYANSDAVETVGASYRSFNKDVRTNSPFKVEFDTSNGTKFKSEAVNGGIKLTVKLYINNVCAGIFSSLTPWGTFMINTRSKRINEALEDVSAKWRTRTDESALHDSIVRLLESIVRERDEVLMKSREGKNKDDIFGDPIINEPLGAMTQDELCRMRSGLKSDNLTFYKEFLREYESVCIPLLAYFKLALQVRRTQ